MSVSPATVAGNLEKLSVTCPMLTEPVTIDGKWTSTTEWTDAPEFSMSPYGKGWWRCKHDATFLYILVESLVDTEAESYVTTLYKETPAPNVTVTLTHPLTEVVGDEITIQLDTRHNGGAWPSTDDYDFSAKYVNAGNLGNYTDLYEGVGNGQFWNTLVGAQAIPGVQARIDLDTEYSPHPPHPHVTGEFKIPLSLFPSQVIGFYIIMTDGSGDASKTLEWPPFCEDYGVGRLCEDYPDTWGDVSIQPNTSSPVTVSSSVTTTLAPVTFPTVTFTTVTGPTMIISTSSASPATSTSVQTVSSIITTMQMRTDNVNASGQYCFWYRYWYFPAQKGEQLSTTIESNSSIDFYLLTKADFDSWNGTGFSCQLSGISSPLVNQTGITHYDLSITIPSDGTYYYIFINRSPDKAASVTYGYPSVMTSRSVQTISSPVTTSYVMTTESPVTASPVSTSPASLTTSTFVQTIYNTVTTTQMATTTKTTTLIVGAPPSHYCLLFRSLRLWADKGQQLSSTVESNSSIDFYLLTKADYDSWNGTSCDLAEVSKPLANQIGITHYLMNVTVPTDGMYYYVFINRSHDKAASVMFTYPAVTGAISVLTVSSVATTSSVVTISLPQVTSPIPASTVASESAVAETPGTGQSVQLDSRTLLIVVAAVAGAFLGYVAARRRSRIPAPPPPP